MSENCTVYRRIAEVQKELMQKTIPKSGKNKFGGFTYYELEDILPPIFNECFKRELVLDFTFTQTEAILKVRDWNTPGEVASTRVPMPEIREMNSKMNIVQSEGAYITYLKRYLLTNMFLIMEKDIIDAEDQTRGVQKEPFKRVAPKREQPKRSKPASNNGRPVGEKVTGEVKAPNDLIKSVVGYCNNLNRTPNATILKLAAAGMKRKGLINKEDVAAVKEFANKLQEEDIVVVA